MTQDDPAFPMPPPLKRSTPPKAPEYIVALEDAPGIRSGQVVPNTQENAKALEGKCRPATDIDVGVAGIIRKA
jgi:hypothetical protein